MNKILSSKIKDIAYLINQVSKKEEQLSIPLFSFLLGAGCSITSNLPSGGRIIEICKNLTFIENSNFDNSVFERDFTNFFDYLNKVEEIIEKHKIEFDEFVRSKEKEFKEDLNKEYVYSKISPQLKKRLCKGKEVDGEELKDYIFDNYKDFVFQDDLYGKWFEAYTEDPRERQKLIEKIIDSQDTSGEYIILSFLMKEGLIHNIFTTNFDDLLNETLGIYSNVKARVYSHNELARYISIASKKPNIIKLHGDYLFENIKNTVYETNELELNMATKFKEALDYLGLIVIGYNGADYSIMSALESIKQERDFPLLWCVRDLDKLHWRVVDLINNTRNSYAIKVEDFSTLIVKLWSKYGKSDFDLLSEAQNRQRKIKDFLEEANGRIQNNSQLDEKDKAKLDETVNVFALLSEAKNIKDLNEKIGTYYRILEIAPENFFARLNLGINLVTLANKEIEPKSRRLFSQAIYNLEQAIKIDPKSPAALNSFGVLYLDLAKKKSDKEKDEYLLLAESHLLKAIEFDPNYFMAYTNLANVLDMIAENKSSDISIPLLLRAIELNKKALELEPSNYKLLVNLGGDYYSVANLHLEEGTSNINGGVVMNLLVRAIESYSHAASLKDDTYEAFFNWGLAITKIADNFDYYYNESTYLDAIDKQLTALKFAPNNDAIHYEIGRNTHKIANLLKGEVAIDKYHNAIEYYRSAIKLNPSNEWAHHYLGLSYCQIADQKNGDEANQYYKNGIEKFIETLAINPKSEQTYLNMGFAFEKLAELSSEKSEKLSLYKKSLDNYQKVYELIPAVKSESKIKKINEKIDSLSEKVD